MNVVWIDERRRHDPQRLRRAHIRARQARIARSYEVSYHHQRQLVKATRPDRQLIDSVMLAGAVALVVLMLGLYQ